MSPLLQLNTGFRVSYLAWHYNLTGYNKPWRMTTNGKILLGFLFGAVMGSVAALLSAPATGMKTRKNLNKKAMKMVKQIQGLIGTGKTGEKKKTGHAAHAKNGRAGISTR